MRHLNIKNGYKCQLAVSTILGIVSQQLGEGYWSASLNWGALIYFSEENMALVICPECGRQISDKSTHCIGCGCPMTFIVNELKNKERQEPMLNINVRKPPNELLHKTVLNWDDEIQKSPIEELIDEDNESFNSEDELNWDDDDISPKLKPLREKYSHVQNKVIKKNVSSWIENEEENFDDQEYEEYLKELSSYADDMERANDTGWFYSDYDDEPNDEDGLPAGFHVWNGDDDDL